MWLRTLYIFEHEMYNVHADLFLARYARAGVQAFLKGVASFTDDGTDSHDAWLPPLTAYLLLEPHLGLFPFPSYFRKLHEFLAAFYHSGRENDFLFLVIFVSLMPLRTILVTNIFSLLVLYSYQSD